MPLKAVLTSTEGLDEAVQGLYKQVDGGKYVLDIEGVDDLPAVSGLKAKNHELLGKVREANERLSSFGDVTPDQIEELRKAGTAQGGERMKELEQKLAAQAEASRREIEQAKQEAEKARSANMTAYKQREVAFALAEARANPKLLSHVVEGHVDVRMTDDGTFQLQVVGPDGQPRIKDGQGNAVTLKDLLTEMKGDPDYRNAFDVKVGSDAPPSSGGSGGSGSAVFDRSDPMAWGKHAEAITKGEARPA